MWVHHFYLKGQEWKDYTPGVLASWGWKKICELKEAHKDRFSRGTWQNGEKMYSIPVRKKMPTVGWSRLVWNKWALPKHQFISWLGCRDALNTKSRLLRHGVSTNGQFCLCDAVPETTAHLFFGCLYSRILQLIEDWLGIKMGTDLLSVRPKGTGLQKKACYAAVTGA